METQPTTMYSISTPESYRYRVILWSTEYRLPDGFWWVRDTKRGRFRKIGRVSLRGVNYYDRAIEFCQEKQREESNNVR